MNRALAILMAAALSSLSASGQDVYRAFAGNGGAHAMVVQQLEGIRLRNVDLKNLPLRDAVSKLQDLGMGKGQRGGVINTVIRDIDRPSKKVTLKIDSISFAKAIDTICTQAGYRWSIEGETNSLPMLVLAPNTAP